MAAVAVAPIEVPKPQKKEIEVIKVLGMYFAFILVKKSAEKVTGHVKWYSPVKRYGFISRNDDGGDLFVHRSVITAYSRPFPSLLNGEEVEFSVVETNQGIEALYVTGPGGQPVKGARPFRRRYRTSSEPAHENESSNVQQNSASGDGGHPRNSGRRVRTRRRRGPQNADGRTTGPVDGQANRSSEEDHQDTVQDERDESKDLPESPTNAVPRQRRSYRGARHRSAPTEATSLQKKSENDNSGLDKSTEGGESRNPPRRFRRPFRRPFGGLRYSNGQMNGRSNGGSFSNQAGAGDFGYQQGNSSEYMSSDRNRFHRGRGTNSYMRRFPRRRPQNNQRILSNGHDNNGSHDEGNSVNPPLDREVSATAHESNSNGVALNGDSH